MTLIYIAGPDIFRPDARIIAERQKGLCRDYGFVPLHPLDGDLLHAATPAGAMNIFQANRARMHAAGAIVANVTPFRGPSADPGTVFELGYMLALGRVAAAYTKTLTSFRERTIKVCQGATFSGTGSRWTDADGMEIEDFGLADNLMIDCGLRSGGIPLIRPASLDESPTEFECFERCLQTIRHRELQADSSA